MRVTMLFIFMFPTFIFPGTITLSKDSLKVCNNPAASRSDYLIITNSSDDTIALDSAYIIIDSMDTLRFTSPIHLQIPSSSIANPFHSVFPDLNHSPDPSTPCPL